MKGTTKRICSGVYEYLVNGRIFLLEEVKRSEGFPGKAQWNISEVIVDRRPCAFDAADTLHAAKCLADAASQNR